MVSLLLNLNDLFQRKMVKGPGGAIDLTSSGSRVVVTMEHVAKVFSFLFFHFVSSKKI
jgi:acyl CoA:acetate/3-ketoacid CoA transferase beta subunit